MSPIDPLIELKLQIIEKDIQLLQVKQKELEEYTKQIVAIGYKMSSLEDKLDEVFDKLEKISDRESTHGKTGLNITADLVKYIGWIILILAAAFGIKVALPLPVTGQEKIIYVKPNSITTVYNIETKPYLFSIRSSQEDV